MEILGALVGYVIFGESWAIYIVMIAFVILGGFLSYLPNDKLA